MTSGCPGHLCRGQLGRGHVELNQEHCVWDDLLYQQGEGLPRRAQGGEVKIQKQILMSYVLGWRNETYAVKKQQKAGLKCCELR